MDDPNEATKVLIGDAAVEKLRRAHIALVWEADVERCGICWHWTDYSASSIWGQCDVTQERTTCSGTCPRWWRAKS